MRTRIGKTTTTLLVALGALQTASADSVRLWPTAVVSTGKVTLGDICQFTDAAAADSESVSSEVVVAAPPPGGSTIVDASVVQVALHRAGFNPATLLLTGATRCAVSRPTIATSHSEPRQPKHTEDLQPGKTGNPTLRDAVADKFRGLEEDYGGTVDLEFGRTAEQVLSLSEPNYTFDVRLRSAAVIGRLINAKVDVLSEGELVQTVHLVVTATLRKRVVIARRAINMKATVRADDVELAERSFDNAKEIGISDMAAVVGLRARHFMTAGRSIRAADLESVPLVKRGQLVEVISLVGGIEARSAAKAISSGGLGDTVELRMGDGRGQKLTAVVAGERRVTIGTASRELQFARTSARARARASHDHVRRLALGAGR